jgi:hypothetical protein
MTITTRDGLVDALGNSATTFIVAKASIANAIAGGWYSLWRATGVPGQGAIPGAVVVNTKADTGAFTFANPVGPVRSYLARLFLQSGNGAHNVEVHDRLSSVGGLNGTLTTAQTANVDVSVSTSNMVLRKGDANYSDVQWWLEWYTDTGATATNATCAVTYDDASTGNVVVALTATMRAGRMLPILSAVPGRFIRSIQTVTLTASTLTAGSFGVTATREHVDVSIPVANKGELWNWADLGLARIHDDACLFLACMPSTTTTGVLNGSARLAQG